MCHEGLLYDFVFDHIYAKTILNSNPNELELRIIQNCEMQYANLIQITALHAYNMYNILHTINVCMNGQVN